MLKKIDVRDKNYRRFHFLCHEFLEKNKTKLYGSQSNSFNLEICFLENMAYMSHMEVKGKVRHRKQEQVRQKKLH